MIVTLRRMVASVVLFALTAGLLVVSPVSAWAQEDVEADTSSASVSSGTLVEGQSTSTEPAPGLDLTKEGWTEYSHWWPNADGSMTMEMTPGKSKFKDEAGDWREIDLSMVEAADGSGFVAKQAEKKEDKQASKDGKKVLKEAIKLAKKSSKQLARTLTSAGELSFGHVGISSVDATLSADGMVARYPQALSGGRDVLMRLTVNGFEDAVVVPDLKAGNSYDVDFALPVGVTARSGGPGVEFVDTAGTVVATYGGGVAFDAALAAGGPYSETSVVSDLVKVKDGTATVRVSIDRGWFTEPARVWPVTIDPQTTSTWGLYHPPCPTSGTPTTYDGCDTYVNSDNPTGAYEAQTQLRVGSPNQLEYGSTTLKNRTRTFIKFQTDSGWWGTGFDVISAKVQLFVYGGLADVRTFNMYGMCCAWNASTTWGNQPPNSTPDPRENGRDSTSKTNPYAVATFGGSTNSWVTFEKNGTSNSLGVLAQRWANGSPDYGVRLETAGDEREVAAFRQFYSVEYGSTYAPRLTITYWKTPSAPLSLTSSAGVETASVSWAKPTYDGGGIRGYTAYRYTGGGTLIDSKTVCSTCLSATFSKIAGGSYKFKVRALSDYGDGDLSGFSATVTATTDAPTVPSVSSSTHPATTTPPPWYANDDPALSWSATDTSDIGGFSYVLDQVSSTTPDTVSEGTGKTKTYSNLADGTWWFHVRAMDIHGTWGSPKHFQIRIDDTAPPAPTVSSSTHPSQTAWYANSSPALSWTASDTSGINGYSYVLDQVSTTTPDTTSEGTATSITYSGKANGTWYFHVRARNGSGLWGTTRHYTINIDTTAPSGVTISSTSHPDPNVWAGKTLDASWTTSTDALSGVAGYAVAVDQTSATTPTGTLQTTTTHTKTVASDGIWYLHVRPKDKAGNWGTTAHYKFGVDTGSAAITVPAEGQTLQGAVTLEASSSPSATGATFQVYTGGDPALSSTWKTVGTDNAADASYKWHADWNTDARNLDDSRVYRNGPYRVRVVFSYSDGSTRAVNGPLVTVDDTRLGIASHWTFRDLGNGAQVNLATGNVVATADDVSLPTGTGAITVTRSYNSRGASKLGSLGWGWELGLPTDSAPATFQELQILERDTSNGPATVGIVDVTGEVVYFLYDQTLPSGPAWVVEASEHGLSLSKDADGLWTLTDDEDVRYRFEIPAGWPIGSGSTKDADYDEIPLTVISPPNGTGTTTYGYLPDGRLDTVNDTLSGKQLKLTWTADGKVDRILAGFDNSRVAVDYDYDASGRLTSATGRDGLTAGYSYGSTSGTEHLLTTMAPPGLTALTLDYDAAITGKLTKTRRLLPGSATDEATTTFTYAVQADGGVITTVRPPRGAAAGSAAHDWTYTFDAASRETAMTPPGGVTRVKTWDAHNHLHTSQTAAEAASGTHTAYRYSDTIACVAGATSDGTELCELIGPAQTYTSPGGTIVQGAPTTRYFYDDTSFAGYTPVPNVGKKLKTREVSPDGTTTVHIYGTDGFAARQPNRTVVLDVDGVSVLSERRYTYDGYGRITSETLPKGTAASAPDPAYTTTFTYGTDGLLKTRSKPNTSEHNTTYNPWGQPVTETDGSGTTILDYDLATGRLARTTDPSTKVTTHTYHPATGLPDATSDSTGTVSRTYDNWGRLTSQTDATGGTSTFTYDRESNLTSRADQHATTTYTHDAMGRTTSVIDPAGTITYTYANDETLRTTVLPNGITATVISRAGAGDLDSLVYTDQTGTIIGAFDRDYDVEGRVISESRPSAERRYTYDGLGRVTTAADVDDLGAPLQTRTYTYDDNTNRATKTVTDAAGTVTRSESYTYDTADRLQTRTVDGAVNSYTYDAAGNTLTDDGRIYTWTATNRIQRIDTTIENQAVSIGYTLDPLGRTLIRGETRNGANHVTTVHHYADDTDSPSWTKETDMAGMDTVTRHVQGPAGLVASHKLGADITYPLHSPHGERWATTDSAGAVLATTDHDEFGVPLTASTGDRYGWLARQQRETDPVTGILLMGVRLYQPEIGRFLTTDPIYGGSATDYDYCNADPINCYDLDGKHSWWSKTWSKARRYVTPRRVVGWATSAATAAVVAGCIASVGCGVAAAAATLGYVYMGSTAAYAFTYRRSQRSSALRAPVRPMVIGAACGYATGGGCATAGWRKYRGLR